MSEVKCNPPGQCGARLGYSDVVNFYKPNSQSATGFTQVNTIVTQTKYRRKDGIFAAVSTPISTAAG